MDEFERLIEAARQGVVEDVKAIAHAHPEFVARYDETGATAVHYAAFCGHRDVVRVLVEAGADVNATDTQFNATPAGWAIEYLRGMGGFLEIELRDFAYAIERGDVVWVARFLKRFPALRRAHDSQGRAFKAMAEQCGNEEIRELFADPAK
jgi:hypothetical protein